MYFHAFSNYILFLAFTARHFVQYIHVYTDVFQGAALDAQVMSHRSLASSFATCTRFAQEEEEVQAPEEVEEVEEVEEEVREEGTFEEEAWEGDYQAEEYVEAGGRHWEASQALFKK